MTGDPIPEDVNDLLRRHFTSASEIEVLLVLVRDPRPWSQQELARRLVINDDHALTLLRSLVRVGLVVEKEGAYLFRPSRPKDLAAVEALERIYDAYRVRIIHIVLSTPADPLRHFADAFKLRSPEDQEGET